MKNPTLKESDSLYQDIESRIKNIKDKKNLYIVLYRTTKVVVFLAGAMITVLTGWKMYGTCTFNPENAVLVISSGVSLLAAVDGLFAFRDKGKGYDFILFDLRRLRDRICFEFMQSPELYNQNKPKHFEDYQKILESQKAMIENDDFGDE